MKIHGTIWCVALIFAGLLTGFAQEDPPLSLTVKADREQMKNETWVYHVTGTTNMVTGTVLNVEIFYLKKAPFGDERVPFTVAKGIARVKDGKIDARIGHAKRRPYSGPHLAECRLDPDEQPNKVLLETPQINGPELFIGNFEIGTEEAFEKETQEARELISKDIGQAIHMFDDLLKQFQAQQESFDVKTWETWADAYMGRLEQLDIRNADRPLYTPLLSERRGRLWIEGLIKRIISLVRLSDGILREEAPEDALDEFKNRVREFERASDEFLGNLGISTPIDKEVVVPLVDELGTVAKTIIETTLPLPESWSNDRSALEQKVAITLFKLSAETKDEYHHGIALFQIHFRLALDSLETDDEVEHGARRDALTGAYADLKVALGVE